MLRYTAISIIVEVQSRAIWPSRAMVHPNSTRAQESIFELEYSLHLVISFQEDLTTVDLNSLFTSRTDEQQQ